MVILQGQRGDSVSDVVNPNQVICDFFDTTCFEKLTVSDKGSGMAIKSALGENR
jgi:hypothetical protein